MSNKYQEKFYEVLHPFFEDGILKEIYRTEEICICNMSNSSYVIFEYELIKEGKDKFNGIMFSGKNLELVVKNPDWLYGEFLKLNRKEQDKLLVPINNNAFEVMRQLKKETDIKGPTKDINLNFEQKLLKKNK